MEVFLKRAEKPYKVKLGEEKAKIIFEKIKRAVYLIPGEFSGTLGAEIPRFLFTYSKKLEDMSIEHVEGILRHILIFTNSLLKLTNMNLNQMNQKIINRSKYKMRTMLDLLTNFVEKSKTEDFLKDSGSIEDILDYLTGEESFIKLDELEVFVKKAKDNLLRKIGEEKASLFSKEILLAFKNIADELKNYIDSEIAKFLFTFSQDIDSLPLKVLEDILKHVVLFTQSLSDIGGKNKEQINQEMINRSNNNLRGLLDLFKSFLDKAKEGKVLESFQNFEDIINYTIGAEKEHIKFTDVGGFLKRAEKRYMLHLGEVKGQMLISNILNSLSNLPEAHRAYLASDISRFLTTYSETMNKLDLKEIEKTLTRTLMFTEAITGFSDLNKEEMNQFIINRSKHTVRNLFELYKIFLEVEKTLFMKSNVPTFDEILNYTLGKYVAPKTFKITDEPMYELLKKYSEELPIVDDFKEAPEPVERYNPLEELFNKYREELTIVASTSTLENFTEAFTFWIKEDVLPLTLNKAEELLLKSIFKKIRKKLQVIIKKIEEQQTLAETSEEAPPDEEVEGQQVIAEISDEAPPDEEVEEP